MQTLFRKTVKETIRLKGIGLHSGKTVRLNIHPAESGHGLKFNHSQPTHSTIIPVHVDYVIDTGNAVTLGKDQVKIQTIEHLMAALHTLGITDALIDIDSTEVPIMDGSSLPFLEAIQSTGWIESKTILEPIQITNPIWVVEGDKYLVLLPSDELKVTYSIDFNHPLLRGQSFTTNLDQKTVLEDILPARTFGFLKDVEQLQSKGLALGGSLDNAVVLTEDGYLNDSLRYENECVRHKVLDLIGDLAVLGRPFTGHLIASKAGHGLDISLARCILEQEKANEMKNFRQNKNFSQKSNQQKQA
ncbi:UDP-3-O-acyl-N-acetylglucosamine deacetylase [Leptospira sp. GIMC2001]|uniref:UDP-3-O-acyl-N-acetylglucosamine deacetylase n=1 Tax=Leptospira sp. GIMC2001 TaxID=1513297 RepID=UPI00234AD9E1|nr:UDP-3-O-acyl-N-acetylglucosamine deacetylase [Leptospira sp. GIMC2001]WCL50944.1 UDP-3-O-acyl-N-acetylglucosamine deacetylase [Leptospira sp. GIMC2001]